MLNVTTIKSIPLVSIIVPTWNRSEMLAEALKSIHNQTYPHFEIIVVNDGGMDVAGIISSLNTKNNIRYLVNERSRGAAAARNEGFRVAKGKYIAYLDDDDIYYPDHLATLVSFLENSE